ncbi:MAG: hypothetical protein JOY62_03825 [Acidobacteriaceae bacterium]|nr:hypothetical protein [Acidobacteriaceae bacterium]
MKNGQPNGSELVISRRAGIYDAAAEVQVGLGVTVIKDAAGMETPKHGECDEKTERSADN